VNHFTSDSNAMSSFLPQGDQAPADRQGPLRIDNGPNTHQNSNVHLMSIAANSYFIEALATVRIIVTTFIG
jgi:hypothetical protein